LTILIELIYNLSILVSISLAAGLIPRSLDKPRQEGLMQGLLFGLATMAGMLHPLTLSPGLIFDGRSVMISLAAAFFGPWAAVVAGVLAASLRLYQGGAGAYVGVGSILAAAGCGLIFYWRFGSFGGRRLGFKLLLLMGFVTTFAVLLLMLLLPGGQGWVVLAKIGFPMMVSFPLATGLIGMVLFFSLERRQLLQEKEAYCQQLITDQRRMEEVIEELTATEEELRSQQETLAHQYRKLDEQSKELEKSSAKNKALLRALPDLAFNLDCQGKFLDYHDRDASLLHFTPDLIGKPMEQVLPHDLAVTVDQLLGELLLSKEMQSTIYLLEIDGTIQTLDMRMVLTEAGEILVLVRDVSLEKASEASLQKSEERFRNYFNSSPTGIFIADEQGNYLDVNPAACKMTAYPREELLGKNLLELVPEAEHHLARESFADLLSTGRTSVETSYRRRDGSLGYWRVEGANLGDGTGIGFVVDLTRLHAYQQELIQAKEKANEASLAKSRFLANMSHEIRTPLNGLMGFAQLLAETALDQEQSEYLKLMKGSSDVLLRVVGDILDHAKIESGKLELEQVPFGLASLVEDVEGMFRLVARQKGVSLKTTVADEIPEHLVGDSFRLRQILVNLVGNAVKYTTAGSVALDVRLLNVRSRTEVNLIFTVSDTGIGIPPEKIEHIFDNFVQGDSSSTRRFGGSGLGLAIARGLAELMGGSLWVESRPGEGSVFYFSCVLEVAVEIEVPPGSNLFLPVVDTPSEAGLALVVEDEPVSRMVADKLLRKLGWRTLVANDGAEGVKAWQEGNPDLILMDIQMPVMDGYQATGRIRSLEPAGQSQVPIIALTAHALLEDKEKCLAAGMSDYLTKPIDAAKLKAMLDKWSLRNSSR